MQINSNDRLESKRKSIANKLNLAWKRLERGPKY